MGTTGMWRPHGDTMETTWGQHRDHRDVETTWGPRDVETTWGPRDVETTWGQYGDNMGTMGMWTPCGDNMGTT